MFVEMSHMCPSSELRPETKQHTTFSSGCKEAVSSPLDYFLVDATFLGVEVSLDNGKVNGHHT